VNVQTRTIRKREHTYGHVPYENLKLVQVLDFLGRGGFGEVRVGEHQLSRERVALKFLRKSEMCDIGAAQRTATEVGACTARVSRVCVCVCARVRLWVHGCVVACVSARARAHVRAALHM
jgi:hypothetical protein